MSLYYFARNIVRTSTTGSAGSGTPEGAWMDGADLWGTGGDIWIF